LLILSAVALIGDCGATFFDGRLHRLAYRWSNYSQTAARSEKRSIFSNVKDSD
jgi:hypothetical protein